MIVMQTYAYTGACLRGPKTMGEKTSVAGVLSHRGQHIERQAQPETSGYTPALRLVCVPTLRVTVARWSSWVSILCDTNLRWQV